MFLGTANKNKMYRIRADIKQGSQTGEDRHKHSFTVNVPIEAKLKQKEVKVIKHYVFLNVILNV